MAIASLFRVSALSVIAICGLVAMDQVAPGVFVAEAVAQDKPKKDTRETRRTPALRNKVYERLAEAQTLAEAKDYAGAAAILNDMISEDGKRALNSYELANVYNLHAFLSYAKEDYPQSLRYYEQVIAQPDIPLAMEINTRFTIAQLYFVQEKWQQGIDALLMWFEMNEKPNAGAYVLLAQGTIRSSDTIWRWITLRLRLPCTRAKESCPKSSGITSRGSSTSTKKTLIRRSTC